MDAVQRDEVEPASQESIDLLEVAKLKPRKKDQRKPADGSGQSAHGDHFAIFCLKISCDGGHEKCKVNTVGTCFLMSNLNETASEYFHFATCAHTLYCLACERYACATPVIRIGGNEDILMLKTFPVTDDDWGWMRVPKEYRDPCDEESPWALHDYGVLAVKKENVNPLFDETMLVAKENMIRVNPSNAPEAGFYPRAFLCGYEGSKVLYCSADGKTAPKPRQHRHSNALKERRMEERTADGLYLTKQNHYDDDPKRMTWKKSESPLGKRLLRYYLDSSGGQSGSPIRLPSGDAVGIHRGYRKSSRPEGMTGAEDMAMAKRERYQGCNIGVHLHDPSVLLVMESWVNTGGRRTQPIPGTAGNLPHRGVDKEESGYNDLDVEGHLSLRDCGSSSEDEEGEEGKHSEDEQLEPAAKVVRNPDEMSLEVTEGC